ncbi:MAG: putative cobaltochelatase [Methanolinea sp.]|nr:putative cobaltochelatase [Methanolinea sp.]
MHHFTCIYPFSAIVGQERMKKALLLNAINPRIGGVLIKGERGTAKSTAVRALANLLPEKDVVKGCRFGCDPAMPQDLCMECASHPDCLESAPARMMVIELPISATEDKVVGSLDIEHALKKGEKKFEPGILAAAHRNILYVDEVNLLNDHIVDVLLDVAAMGINIIEREGVSYTHPSSFILVGTMNPEEGELRPQLLDRFGLCVEVEGIRDVETRVELIRRRVAFESDPVGFSAQWAEKENQIRKNVIRAREILPKVSASAEIYTIIAQICADMNVDGHRADITMLKTALTIAAWHGRLTVNESDVREAAELVLPHRMRRTPFTEEKMEKDRINQSIEAGKRHSRDPEPRENNKKEPDPEKKPNSSEEVLFPMGDPFRVKQSSLQFRTRPDDSIRRNQGKRTLSESRDGRYTGSRIPKEISPDIAFDATLRAAAPYQKYRKGDLAIQIECNDIREKVRTRKISSTLIFLVDASGSMGVQQRMTAVKTAVLSLLVDAYQKRDRVGLIAFRGEKAEVLLPPTSSVELAKNSLVSLPTGGKTPLAEGLRTALRLIGQERMRQRDIIPLLILISDGKANVSPFISESPIEAAKAMAHEIRAAEIPSLVIDSERGFLSFGLARQISEIMGGRYLKLEDIRAEAIVNAVRNFGM